MLFLKNKYNQLEDKVNKTMEAEHENALTSSNTQSKSSTCETMKELAAIKEEISATTKKVSELDRKVSNWFQSITENLEEERQRSRKNNLLVHGKKNLPPIYGTEFICFIAQELNYMFPSLSGTILPCHIDDAHPLRTKKGGTIIIIRFINRWIKDEILSCKNDLPPYLSVTEHLTENSLNLLSAAKALVGNENVRVLKTTIFARHNGNKLPIKHFKDIDALRHLVSSKHTIATVPSATEAKTTDSAIVSSTTSSINVNNNVSVHERPSSEYSSSSKRPQGRPSYNGRGGANQRGFTNRSNYRNDYRYNSGHFRY